MCVSESTVPGALPGALPEAPAVLAARTDDAGMPADWPVLWQQLLQARGATAADTVPSAGWQAGGAGVSAGHRVACSTAGAAWLQVYQPLLDARLALAPGGAAAAMPWAIAQLGQSLDGCVATAAGDSYFVTGAQSLLHLHRLRALCDAVLVGAGTVASDDPQLTTRRVPGPHPVRVVLDPEARLDGRARMLRDGAAPSLWLCDSRHADTARARLGQGLARGPGPGQEQASGPSESPSLSPSETQAQARARAPASAQGQAEVLAVDGLLDAADPGRGPDMARAMAALAARGLRVLLVEGGGVTVSRCLAAGLLDRLHLVIAPVIIGAGRRGLQHPGPLRMADCPRPPAQRLALGEDMLWDLDLRAAPVPAPAPG